MFTSCFNRLALLWQAVNNLVAVDAMRQGITMEEYWGGVCAALELQVHEGLRQMEALAVQRTLAP